MSNKILRHGFVLVLGVILYFAQGPRLVRHPTDRLADKGDSILNAWIMAWDSHALTTPGVDVWDAPIHYPVRNALAFSETMFGNLWSSLPINWFTGNPILAANLHILVSFVLCLYTTFLLVESLTGCFPAGVVAGVIFSYNPIRWGYLGHMHLLPFFWAPLALMFCHRFLQTLRLRPLLLMVLSLVAQYYVSFNLGTITSVTLLVFGAIHCLIERSGRDRFFFVLQPSVRWMLLGGGIVGILLLLPVALPTLHAVQDWNFIRTEADNATFSCEFLGFFKPGGMFATYQNWDLRMPIRGEYWFGFTPWLLAFSGLILARLGSCPEENRLVRRFAWTAVVAAVLMLGPNLVWQGRTLAVPMPYLLVFYLVPGARGMRTPVRYFLPLLLCLSVLAGFAVALVLRRWRTWGPAGITLASVGVAAWLGLDYAVSDIEGVVLPPRDRFPPVYDYLAKQDPTRPILELPAIWDRQFEYQYFQIAHWRPLVNGQTGCSPPAAMQESRRTEGKPTEAILEFIRMTVAMTLVVHLDRYDEATALAWQSVDLEPYCFRRVGTFGNDLVWERAETLPETSHTLRVTNAEWHRQTVHLRERVSLTLKIKPSEAGKPWRYLDRGVQEVNVIVTDVNGRITNSRKKISVPPYLLPEEIDSLVIEPIAVSSGTKCVRIEGPLLDAFETTYDP